MSVVVKRNDSKVVVNKKESNVTVNKNTLASSFSSFSAAGDTGTSTITNNETLTLTGGTGITTAVSGDTDGGHDRITSWGAAARSSAP